MNNAIEKRTKRSPIAIAVLQIGVAVGMVLLFPKFFQLGQRFGTFIIATFW